MAATGSADPSAPPPGSVPPGFELGTNQQGIPLISREDKDTGQVEQAIWTPGRDEGEYFWDGTHSWWDSSGQEHPGHYPAGRPPRQAAGGPTPTPGPSVTDGGTIEKGNRPGPEKGNAP